MTCEAHRSQVRQHQRAPQHGSTAGSDPQHLPSVQHTLYAHYMQLIDRAINPDPARDPASRSPAPRARPAPALFFLRARSRRGRARGRANARRPTLGPKSGVENFIISNMTVPSWSGLLVGVLEVRLCEFEVRLCEFARLMSSAGVVTSRRTRRRPPAPPRRA